MIGEKLSTLADRARISASLFAYVTVPQILHPLDWERIDNGYRRFLEQNGDMEFAEAAGLNTEVCFSYAFGIDNVNSGINEPDQMVEIVNAVQRSTDFRDEPQRDDHVWYFSGKEPVHIGFLEEDGRVRSKWSLGPVFVHPKWKVPLSYGSSIKYATQPSEDFIRDLERRVLNEV